MKEERQIIPDIHGSRDLHCKGCGRFLGKFHMTLKETIEADIEIEFAPCRSCKVRNSFVLALKVSD